jgi:hypothetical protein
MVEVVKSAVPYREDPSTTVAMVSQRCAAVMFAAAPLRSSLAVVELMSPALRGVLAPGRKQAGAC